MPCSHPIEGRGALRTCLLLLQRLGTALRKSWRDAVDSSGATSAARARRATRVSHFAISDTMPLPAWRILGRRRPRALRRKQAPARDGRGPACRQQPGRGGSLAAIRSDARTSAGSSSPPQLIGVPLGLAQSPQTQPRPHHCDRRSQPKQRRRGWRNGQHRTAETGQTRLRPTGASMPARPPRRLRPTTGHVERDNPGTDRLKANARFALIAAAPRSLGLGGSASNPACRACRAPCSARDSACSRVTVSISS